MIDNYKNIEFQLYGYLIQLRQIFQANCTSKYEIENINKTIELIQNRKFNVAVMGEFKRGKSSLINALLGVNILPSDVTPTTATINRITYGTEPSMTIFYYDETTEVADIDNISEYVTMLTEEGLKRAEEIREAVIHYPTVICQNHVDIIDTPGLNDNRDMTAITMNMLGCIDAAIVVISALAPFSEKEAEFVGQLIKSDSIENIVFVVTFIDEIDEDEQNKFITYIHNRIVKSVLELIEKENSPGKIRIKAKQLLDNSLIFGVSSLLAMQSFVAGDRELLKKSRFEIFKTELYEFLTAQQGANTIIKAVKCIQKAGEEFDKLYSNKIFQEDQCLYIIDQKTSTINNYCSEYRKALECALQKLEKPLKECLDDILHLKSVFTNNFTSALSKSQNSQQNEIIEAIASEAAGCWRIANEECAEKLKKKVFQLFTSVMEDYYSMRKCECMEPIEELSKICNFHWQASPCFDKSMIEIITSFGFPIFNWQASPIPHPQYFHNYNLLDNMKYAVEISVEKYYEHWQFLIHSVKNWWMQQSDHEVLAITALLNNEIKENKTSKKAELYALIDTYHKQKSMIQEIREKTEAIFITTSNHGIT
ncbi:dynamin family protein [Clostridium formicaceticum]|nr:dynamin family protein [Clostridium formicaceticum]